MGYIGGYTMDLYCDHRSCKNTMYREGSDATCRVQYFGEDRLDCMHQARRDGWSVSLRAVVSDGREGFGRTLCPIHSGKGKKKC